MEIPSVIFVLGRPIIIIHTHTGFIFISHNLILPTSYLFFRLGVCKNTKFTIFYQTFVTNILHRQDIGACICIVW